MKTQIRIFELIERYKEKRLVLANNMAAVYKAKEWVSYNLFNAAYSSYDTVIRDLARLIGYEDGVVLDLYKIVHEGDEEIPDVLTKGKEEPFHPINDC
jgi:hypothetical protein